MYKLYTMLNLIKVTWPNEYSTSILTTNKKERLLSVIGSILYILKINSWH